MREIVSIPFVILFIELVIFEKFDGMQKTVIKILPYVALIIGYISAMLLLSNSGILHNEQL